MAKTPAVKKPSRPTIDTVTDNVGPHTGVIGEAGLTNDPRPVLKGHGEIGSIIHIRVDSQEVGTVEVGPGGTWTYRLPESLSDGLWRLSVRASNAGGQSLPSAAYMIEVDVTPPSSPVIDQVSAGDAATLSGHAEPFSTVSVYDGNTLLGTATTNADSQWVFPLPSGMADGTHVLTAKAMDLAGNTGSPSAGFDYVIAPAQPTAHAVVDGAGRDSGTYHNDWVTNDGTAGRLISGHVVGVLGQRDRIQISTDGGLTWQDALMKSDGKWVAIDPNAHAGNWTIQTRVVNDAGNSGEEERVAVTLKDSMSMPTDVSFDAVTGSITVKFDPAEVRAGSKLSLMIDGQVYEHALSAKERADGGAVFDSPVAATQQVVAALVDIAGNVSAYRGVEGWSPPGTIFEDFETFEETPLMKYGASFSTRYFDVSNVEYKDAGWKQGLYQGQDMALRGNGAAEPAPSQALVVTNRVRIKLHDGLSANGMSFDLGDVTGREIIKLYFYDYRGRVIYVTPAYTSVNGIHQRVEINLDQDFTRVEIAQEFAATNLVMSWMDNIVFSGPGFEPEYSPVTLDPPTEQTLSGDAAYYGGSDATVFTVADTGYFSGAGAGAHGGAGIDTLKLTGTNQWLDVTALNSGGADKLSGIEVIDITGSGNNMLLMSVADVLNLGQRDAFRQDGYSQMRVNGDSGDRVELAGMDNLAAGGWTNAGTFFIDGEQYVVYRSDALKAEVFVSWDVQVTTPSTSAQGRSALSTEDVLDTGHQNAFPADDDGAQVPGARALAGHAEQPMADSAGYPGAHHVAQDLDQLMQGAAQATVAH
nr:Ig-like domain-containing protein [Burkholderia sp. Ac-20379]